MSFCYKLEFFVLSTRTRTVETIYCVRWSFFLADFDCRKENLPVVKLGIILLPVSIVSDFEEKFRTNSVSRKTGLIFFAVRSQI